MGHGTRKPHFCIWEICYATGQAFFSLLDRILFLVTKSVISSSFLCMGSMVCDRLGQKSFLI